VAAPLSVLPSALPAYSNPPSALARLLAFRAALHACCLSRADALLDLADAAECPRAGRIPAAPEPGAGPPTQLGQHLRRAGPRPDRRRAAPDLLAAHPLAGGQPIYAVDVTTWPRCDAECSPERGLYYHPSRHSAGQPIVAGWAFQRICQLGFARDSWTAPVDAARLHPLDDTDQHAARQIRALVGRLPAGGPVPWFVFDAGYDSAQLSLDLADARVVVLVRLRSDRCFYADPPPRPPGAGGRPRRHGAKFAFADPTTWPAPTPTHVATDDQYGTVTVQAWAGLHPKQHRHPGHGSGAPRPIVRGTILRVQVQRIPAHTRPPKVLWLWWAGPRAVHWIWSLPGGSTPAGSTWSTPSASPSRPSARPPHACGIPLRPSGGPGWCWPATPSYAWPARPWPISGWRGSGPPGQLSPYRVRRGFPRLLCALGSPAAAPKPSGRSPGRPKGRRSGPAVRYPAIKKPTKNSRKKRPTTTKAA
jgi:hypothetical protein